ncbi:hypothetical protein L9F63_004786, partial [Diploptera punctata]
ILPTTILINENAFNMCPIFKPSVSFLISTFSICPLKFTVSVSAACSLEITSYAWNLD